MKKLFKHRKSIIAGIIYTHNKILNFFIFRFYNFSNYIFVKDKGNPHFYIFSRNDLSLFSNFILKMFTNKILIASVFEKKIILVICISFIQIKKNEHSRTNYFYLFLAANEAIDTQGTSKCVYP